VSSGLATCCHWRTDRRRILVWQTIRQKVFLGCISLLPVLVQRIRDFCQPCPVFNLFQQFLRGKEFDAVGWRVPRQPGLRSACVLVPSRQNPPGPRARLSANGQEPSAKRLACPRTPLATEHRRVAIRRGLPVGGRHQLGGPHDLFYAQEIEIARHEPQADVVPVQRGD